MSEDNKSNENIPNNSKEEIVETATQNAVVPVPVPVPVVDNVSDVTSAAAPVDSSSISVSFQTDNVQNIANDNIPVNITVTKSVKNGETVVTPGTITLTKKDDKYVLNNASSPEEKQIYQGLIGAPAVKDEQASLGGSRKSKSARTRKTKRRRSTSKRQKSRRHRR